MEEGNYEEATPPDIWKPRFLFRRYDSAGSSESNNSSFSSASVGSVKYSFSGQNDRATQRKRTISSNISESTRYCEDSLTTVASGRRRGRIDDVTVRNVHDEQTDNGDPCIFCSSMVHERQYYLWESQYTKSSICSRCTNDNEGMRYISYWGTPSYETGSWKKRYRAGRSLDIDLTPLLEVLEKIDRIDTSMYGRKSNVANDDDQNNNMNIAWSCSESATESSDKNVSSKCCRNLESREILENNDKENDNLLSARPFLKRVSDHQVTSETSSQYTAETLAARRLRRLKNRQSIGNLNETNCQPLTDQNRANPSYKRIDNSNINCYAENNRVSTLERTKRLHGEENNDETDESIPIFESIQNSECVDVIEPLQPLIAQSTTALPEDNVITHHYSQRNERKVSQRPEEFEAGNIMNYLQQRRKSNYEDFIAGLETVTSLQRRSTAEKDLTMSFHNLTKNRQKKRYFVPDRNKAISKQNESKVCGTSLPQKNIDTRPETENNKSDDGNSNSSVEEDNQVEKEIAKLHADPEDENTQAQIFNRRHRSRKLVPSFIISSSSSDEDYTEEETFFDIKRRFEKLSSNEIKHQRRSSKPTQLSNISKGRFRLQYLKNSDRQRNPNEIKNKSDKINKNREDERYSGEEGNDGQVLTITVHSDGGSDSQNDDEYLAESSEGTETLINKYSQDSKANIKNTKNKLQEASYTNINDRRESLDYFEKTNDKEMRYSSKFSENEAEKDNTVSTDKLVLTENKTNSDTFISEDSKTSVYSPDDLSQANETRKEQSGEITDFVESFVGNDDITKHKADDSSKLKPFRKVVRNIQATNARARETKYKEITDETEDTNPTIERIKKRLGRKPKYEEDDSEVTEKHDTVMELNGSNDEEVELCWRTRGYNKDFYMSRGSVTGAEILDRYNRALSQRRSKVRRKKGTKSELTDKIIAQSEPISRQHSRNDSETTSHSAPITRVSTQSKIEEIERDSFSTVRNVGHERDKGGVSTRELQTALDRAALCSERMSIRLENQLGLTGSGDSSS